MSTTSKISHGLEETGELLERAISVMFLGACLVVIPCIAAVLVFVTFAAIHPGDDLHFHLGSGSGASGGGGESSDTIVLPTPLFRAPSSRGRMPTGPRTPGSPPAPRRPRAG